MSRFARAALVLATTATVVVALGGCALLAPPHRVSDETTVTGDIRTIELVDSSGSVEVRGDADATETVVHRTVSYRGAERTIDETHEVSGDTLELRGCGRNCSVAYEIDVAAGVDVEGSTSNGAITLEHVGEVDVQTSNGRIELDDVSGDVVAETSNGRIEGSDLQGSDVRATTSNGAIDLELGVAQDVEARTSNGAIDVEVPTGGSYRVGSETSNGRERIGIANDPDGEHTLDLRTSNGAITVSED
ncbi:DUF4097 and DUF4098 domain-containing protein YvlB [Agromyces sp. 3263]|uniref:DUF4097 family beta strand repeat-containing protein n=1 Tax=Agromyces sp. 3263 TaxID=2817750 RepID=UPI00285F99C9|nr:DUF4097 family beta strand repeat-containing protein [Agromyces sp. 3263]MDR6905583.1 DUF4097 and DUF4098 domain-containing protein YvlB [Agromyces sp. 3263]